VSRAKPAETRQGHNSSIPKRRSSQLPIPVPDPPNELNAYGTNLWHLIWEAGSSAYNDKTDFMAISRYCSLSQRRRQLLKVLEEEGMITTGSTGQLVSHPAAKLLDQIEGRLSPLEDRLGLNLESRLRLGISAAQHETKLTAFLNRGAN
jgi:P27 family predicted phage terminase small subunit